MTDEIDPVNADGLVARHLAALRRVWDGLESALERGRFEDDEPWCLLVVDAEAEGYAEAIAVLAAAMRDPLEATEREMVASMIATEGAGTAFALPLGGAERVLRRGGAPGAFVARVREIPEGCVAVVFVLQGYFVVRHARLVDSAEAASAPVPEPD